MIEPPVMVLQGCHECLNGLQQILTNMLAALKRNPDNDTPRLPPPKATTVDFPCCEPKSTDSRCRSPHDLVRIFGGIQKGPRTEHIDALNVILDSNATLEELVPADYLPPESWLQPPEPSTDSVSRSILINGGSMPAREAFYARAKDLLVSNDNGYRTIHRVPLAKNEGPIRFLFFRKLWEELDCMADYWDTSNDRYTDPSPKHQKSTDDTIMDDDKSQSVPQQGSKTSEPDHLSYETLKKKNFQSSQKNDNSKTLPEEPQTVDSEGDTHMAVAAPDNHCIVQRAEASPDPRLYTGHRTSTGSLMPPQFLEKALFSFLDALALPFRLRLVEPRSQPRLQVGPLLFPIPHMASIYRVPLDQARARQGWREGPLLGAVAAEYAVWRTDEEQRGEGLRERVHLLKEVGCVLLLAQRRAMEGKEEVVPGLGNWWAEVPRWGGGTGIAIYKEPAAAEKQCTAMGAAAASSSSSSSSSLDKGKPSPLDPQSRRKVKRTKRGVDDQQKANILIPPSSLREKNVRYERIGIQKRRDGTRGDVDDVSPFSSSSTHSLLSRR